MRERKSSSAEEVASAASRPDEIPSSSSHFGRRIFLGRVAALASGALLLVAANANQFSGAQAGGADKAAQPLFDSNEQAVLDSDGQPFWGD